MLIYLIVFRRVITDPNNKKSPIGFLIKNNEKRPCETLNRVSPPFNLLVGRHGRSRKIPYEK